MAEAKSKDNWQHTSATMTLLANIHRDPKKRKAFTPSDFDPHQQKPQGVIKGKDIRILKDVFCKTSVSEDSNLQKGRQS